MFHNVDHGIILDHVESFGEIQLKQNNRSLGGLALVNVLKCPCKTILYRSPTYESILVTMDNLQNDFLETVSQELGNELKAAI